MTSCELVVASFADVQVEMDDGSKSTIKQLGQITTPRPDKIFINLSSQIEVIQLIIISTIALVGCRLYQKLSVPFKAKSSA